MKEEEAPGMAEKVLGEHRVFCKVNSKDWRNASLAQAPDVLCRCAEQS